MTLSSSITKHTHFFKFPALLFDTCGLTWFAARGSGIEELGAIARRYCLLIPTPVLYELAFGTEDQVGANEAILRKHFMKWDACMEMMAYGFARQQGHLMPMGFVVLNPGYNEWWTARTRLLKYVEIAGSSTGKSKRDLSLDSLIHSCARNCFAPICTQNISDFNKFNHAGATSPHDGTVPLFTPEQVLQSLSSLVEYSEA